MPKLFCSVGLPKKKKKGKRCIFVFIRPWFLYTINMDKFDNLANEHYSFIINMKYYIRMEPNIFIDPLSMVNWEDLYILLSHFSLFAKNYKEFIGNIF